MFIAEAANTQAPALYLLREKGYTITVKPDTESLVMEFTAQKGNISVLANDPLSLLALATLAETYGENWQNLDCDDLVALIS